MAKPRTAKRPQTFAITAPEATRVTLVGSFTHWEKKPVRLKREANGVWRTTVNLPPGEHHYRFIVDGQWRDDPECTMRVANPFGTHNSVRQVA
jgi:1,4-alpha-glucan branching enzyme